jgi:hypothetical protein
MKAATINFAIIITTVARDSASIIARCLIHPFFIFRESSNARFRAYIGALSLLPLFLCLLRSLNEI